MVACSGSDTFRGTWKAVGMNDEKFEINFDAKKFIIKDIDGQEQEYEYTQNSVKVVNSVKTYGIQTGDGRCYFIHFPKSTDADIAIIKDENEKPLYVISRKEYTAYNDVYKLK